MIRKNLIQWQWSDYFTKHRNPLNLFIHLIAVPLFWLGALQLVTGHLILGAVSMLVSFALQGFGHKQESAIPTPFNGFSDFVSRFLVEQFVNFPRFIFSGEWLRSYKNK